MKYFNQLEHFKIEKIHFIFNKIFVQRVYKYRFDFIKNKKILYDKKSDKIFSKNYYSSARSLNLGFNDLEKPHKNR